jgi:hypothetical protein
MAASQPFTFLAPGFTQSLYGTGLPFAAGVAFAPNGDPVLAFGSFFRFDSHSTIVSHGSTIHPLTVHSASLALGLANDPAGNVFANTGSGVEKIDPATGAVLATGGPGGDGLGIEFDPKLGKLVYAGGPGLSFISPSLDPTSAGTLSNHTSSDGLALSPDGAFAFAAEGGINVVDTATGAIAQHISDTTGHCCADGMAFHAGTPQFVVSNNTDGSITRYDFPGGDFSKPPTQSNFANGGSRGDLTDVGADGCLYLTQANTRFADGTVTGQGSLVKLCGGFLPPIPVATKLVANPSIATVVPGATVYLKLSANLTGNGTPLPNEPISFSAGGNHVCTATTDASGTAACSGTLTGVLQSVLALGYQASFAGDGSLQPSSAKGPLVIVLGTHIP